MAEKSVTLKHIVRRDGKQAVFFYDGALTAENGLLTLPANRPEWIRRAWNSGYNLNPDNDARLSTWAEVEELIEKQNAKSVRSAGSTKKNEDTDVGGQPEAGNGLRESEPSGSESVSEPEPSGDSDRSVDDGEEAPKE